SCRLGSRPQRGASMTRSKVLEQISALMPERHPPGEGTGGPSDVGERTIRSPSRSDKGRRMGEPESAERPAQAVQRQRGFPLPPVGSLLPVNQQVSSRP